MPTPELFDPNKEHTLVLIKPDGLARGLTDEVLCRIEARNYILRGLKIKRVSEELPKEHYTEHRDQYFFLGLLEFMSLGPLMVVVVESDRMIGGVHILTETVGPALAAPRAVRGDLGHDWGSKYMENVIHGSDSPTSAEHEITLWFPELVYHE